MPFSQVYPIFLKGSLHLKVAQRSGGFIHGRFELRSSVTSGKLLPLSGPLIFTRKIKGLAGFEFKSGKLEAGRPNAAIYLCVWGNATFNLRGFK